MYGISLLEAGLRSRNRQFCGAEEGRLPGLWDWMGTVVVERDIARRTAARRFAARQVAVGRLAVRKSAAGKNVVGLGRHPGIDSVALRLGD